jgi:UDP-N-acetylglucosamine 2-epimerase
MELLRYLAITRFMAGVLMVLSEFGEMLKEACMLGVPVYYSPENTGWTERSGGM